MTLTTTLRTHSFVAMLYKLLAMILDQNNVRNCRRYCFRFFSQTNLSSFVIVIDKIMLKIVVAIVVDCFDKFGRFSVLQTLSGFFIHLREKFERLNTQSYMEKILFSKLLNKEKVKKWKSSNSQIKK